MLKKDRAGDLMPSPSAPLYSALYGEGLIDGSFAAGYEGMKGVSLFSAGGESRDPRMVTERIVCEAARAAREGFDGALFECLKRSAIGRKVRELDGFETICIRSCECKFDGAEYFDFLSAVRDVTQEDVQAFVAENLRTDRMALSVILPKERKDPA